MLQIVLNNLGFSPRRVVNSLRGIGPFIRDLIEYRRRADQDAMPIGAIFPILHERYTTGVSVDASYFYQDLWAARKIYKASPCRHVDIGSSVAGFIAHLLTFREVEVVDIRPVNLHVSGLTTTITDATTLAAYEDQSLESISTLHACEHFGLGRYGDPINPSGHIQFMRSLARVLRLGGRLYYSVPCGIEKLYFNAHRVISPETVLRTFKDLNLVSFSCVKDDGSFHEDANPDILRNERYGTGMFEFARRPIALR
jgi:hypothetical protein